MFLTLSKTFNKFCGFRLGFGLKITKKNFFWMVFILMFVCLLQAMWYMLVFEGWLIYAFFYGIYWCIMKISGKRITKSTNIQTPQSTEISSPNKKLKAWQIILIIVGCLTVIGVIGNACSSSDNNIATTIPTSSTTEATEGTTLSVLATTKATEETTLPVLASINSDKETIYVGNTIDVTVSDATENVEWKSDNEAIANIASLKNKNDNTASIEGLKKGTAIITAKVGNQELTCKIKVLNNPEDTTHATTVAPVTTTPNTETVYITNTGSKYHRAGCRFLSKSKIEINLAEAKSQGYTPCGTCY